MRRMLILAMVSVMILAIGCSVGYAGDGIDYLALVNKLHTLPDPGEDPSWDPDTEYPDFEWWLARTADGGWQLLNWGYE